MPELPEVQTVVDSLLPMLLNRTIAAVQLNRRDIVTPAELELPVVLARRTIRQIGRRGKRIVAME